MDQSGLDKPFLSVMSLFRGKNWVVRVIAYLVISSIASFFLTGVIPMQMGYTALTVPIDLRGGLAMASSLVWMSGFFLMFIIPGKQVAPTSEAPKVEP
jgi:hypothetical protein